MTTKKFREKDPGDKPCKRKGCVCKKPDGCCDQESVYRMGTECVSSVSKGELKEMAGTYLGLRMIASK